MGFWSEKSSLLPGETKEQVPCVLYQLRNGRMYKLRGYLIRKDEYCYWGYHRFIPDPPTYRGQAGISVYEENLGKVSNNKLLLLEEDDTFARKQFTDAVVANIRGHQVAINRLRSQINAIRNADLS